MTSRLRPLRGAATRRRLKVVLVGIDGAGKTTAARALAAEVRQSGAKAVLYRNPGGRKTLDRWASKCGSTAERMFGLRLLDTVETIIRTAALLRAAVLQPRHGLVLYDRHLHCQLAYRRVRGLPEGNLVPWLLRVLPQPDLVLYVAVDPRVAHARINARDADSESLEFLQKLDAAYRSLDQFASFRIIDAGGAQEQTISALRTECAGAYDRLPGSQSRG
ncbi:dTMP kinase [Arthrobacter sp. H5]|uniref:dTMP kinase n=1 Tax=Arthrobacter sp. H5 TaxID=1267973 RepID=UPI0004B19707|nr:dTMP kinase [Arthrobacter sp. H5]